MILSDYGSTGLELCALTPSSSPCTTRSCKRVKIGLRWRGTSYLPATSAANRGSTTDGACLPVMLAYERRSE